jgi:hypothetical protein
MGGGTMRGAGAPPGGGATIPGQYAYGMAMVGGGVLRSFRERRRRRSNKIGGDGGITVGDCEL